MFVKSKHCTLLDFLYTLLQKYRFIYIYLYFFKQESSLHHVFVKEVEYFNQIRFSQNIYTQIINNTIWNVQSALGLTDTEQSINQSSYNCINLYWSIFFKKKLIVS